ncbi:MAG: class F sortase [Oscillochloridaceae bacterium]|nr:class F sortase [Chloroflexaceae bacterium]MDW8391423.1 class F sortase [Oscillochloridaceae bacterium]
MKRALSPSALSPLVALVTWWLAVSVGGAAPLPQAMATACFLETGYCIGGRIREVWERGGGLMVFGFPITGLQAEVIEGRALMVQWFERARIELHPDLPFPYDALIGRVGAEALARHATTRTVASTAMIGECRVFAETGFSVCGEFLAAWLGGGADLDGDGALTEGESLALYGLPLTPPRTEQLSDGRAYVVQWFERARFELHPEIAEGLVLRGLLGREAAPVAIDPPGAALAALAPTLEPAPAPAASRSLPVRLAIPAIGLEVATVPAGADETGAFVVPDHDVGWFSGSAAPGEGENIVLWGHVLPFLARPHIPAPFARLREVSVGAQVVLYDASGRRHEYVVTQQMRVAPERTEFLFPRGREMVTLIACTGDQIVSGGAVVDFTQRLVVIAEPRRSS